MIFRVVAKPSMPGMQISMVITSTRSFSRKARASSPLDAQAVTVNSGF